MLDRICKVPFCLNNRNGKNSYCNSHHWEKQKFGVKKFKELLPFGFVKNCKVHGYLTVSEAPWNRNHYKCIKCRNATARKWCKKNPDKINLTCPKIKRDNEL